MSSWSIETGYWHKCSFCGSRYSDSDGGCDCFSCEKCEDTDESNACENNSLICKDCCECCETSEILGWIIEEDGEIGLVCEEYVVSSCGDKSVCDAKILRDFKAVLWVELDYINWPSEKVMVFKSKDDAGAWSNNEEERYYEE